MLHAAIHLQLVSLRYCETSGKQLNLVTRALGCLEKLANASILIHIITCFSLFADCCASTRTGEDNLKGVITWPWTPSDVNSTVLCPYKSNGTFVKYASRSCKSNFILGAQWDKPKINQCPYKTKTTAELERLSQVN